MTEHGGTTPDGHDTIMVRVFTEAESDGEEVPPVLTGEEAETQALLDRLRRRKAKVEGDVPVRLDELSKSLRDITEKLDHVLQEQAREETKGARSFTLDSFTVGLSVNAAGKVVLVGEVGIEASIQVTFKRPDSTTGQSTEVGR